MKYRDTPRRRRSPILERSLAATRMWVAKEWERRIESPKLNVVFAPTLDAFRQVGMESGKPGVVNRSILPWVALVRASIQERTAPFAPWQLNKFGLRRGYLNNGYQAVVDKLRPVEVGVGLRFKCSSIDEAEAFAEMWLENQPSVGIELRSEKTGSIVQITLMLDGAISIPPANTASPGDLYDIETTILVRTFTGYSEVYDRVKKLQIGVSNYDGDIDAALEHAYDGDQVAEDGLLMTIEISGDKKVVVTTP